MKILIFGRSHITTNIAALLTRHGIKTNNVSATADLSAVLEKCEKPDIVLIDKEATGAACANEQIQKLWGIPTVLMMGKGKEKWQGLEKFVVSGFVDNALRQDEFIARLSAIQRRVAGNEVNA